MSVKLRKRKYKKKGTRYYLDIYSGPNERTAQFLNIWIKPSDNKYERASKKALAEGIRNRIEQDLESRKYRDVLPKFKKETNFLNYCDHYIEVYKNKDFRAVIASVNHFKVYLKSKNIKRITMNDLNETLAYGFIEYLKKESNLTGSTPFGYLKKFNRIVNTAVRKKYLSENPFNNLSKKGLNKPSIEKHALNDEELRQLFQTQCSNKWIKKAFIISCYTGMGEAELRNLKWKDIDFINEEITYMRLKNGISVTNHLHPIIKKSLFGLDQTNEHVLRDQLPKSTNGINKVLKTWVKHAGIEKHITFYCARHTFGTSVCRVSGNQKVVAEALGHKSTQFTDRYTKIVEREHHKAVKSLPSFSIKNA